MNSPEIVGRTEDQDDDIRATTKLVHTVVVPFKGGANGELSVSLFRSTDDEDRGGIVLRITLRDEEQSFMPTAKIIEGGVDFHMAGDIEAGALIHALKTALATAS